MSGSRKNKGKLRWDLVDFKSLEPMVQVLEKGAIKYSQNNWKGGLHREEILESIQRHLIELFDRVEIDPEDVEHHMAHIMANGMFYLYFYRKKNFSKKRNNPFKKMVN